MTSKSLSHLVEELAGQPTETEWVEFKENNSDPYKIGENCSALANAAALHQKSSGFIVWGIRDSDHAIVGTSFRPRNERVGAQELENWLVTLMEPRVDVKIHETQINDQPVVVFEIQAATYLPIRFRGVEYIRIGSYTKKLADHPEKERAIWKLFDRKPFEDGVAATDVSSEDLFSLLDYAGYFRLLKQPLPENRAAILTKLAAEKLIRRRASDRYDISNLGAILFAKDLDTFNRLARKALRVIIYKGENRVNTIREEMFSLGYAAGFERAVSVVNDLLPRDEQIGQALRAEIGVYPEIAIRELVANALIHQDFNITGAGPIVEIFQNRLEISNPGVPLIDTLRFIDEPPRSRNEALASLMRRMNICEERGSGIDKVIFSVEDYQLPAPDFRSSGSSTVAVLLGPRTFALMDREERVRACYQHACLLYVSGKRMSNSTLRQRLGIKESNYPMASRIISDTVKGKLIKPYAAGTGRRDSSYVPFWA